MKIIASIQARMGSERFPGKVLHDLCGKPMLQWQIERIKKSRLIDEVVVGTTTSDKDDAIEEFCKKNNFKYFRGSENDVLNRISTLIQEYKVDIHVECYGDSPFTDPQIIDEFLGYFLKNEKKIDYLTNSMTTTYPPGMELSIYRGKVLTEVNNIVKKNDNLREHVGYNITRFSRKFKLLNLKAPLHFHFPEIYLEVDTKQDMILIKKIANYFNKKNINHFSLGEILLMIKSYPNLIEINSNVPRRWKEFREN
jgi:spore coat polysaccharide biosynthesis protein SpsF